jgi:hypothetical protein
MDETRRLELPYGASLTCRLVAVVRDHHDSMVGNDRERPGFDRVRLQLQNGDEVIADVWTRTAQSISSAPAFIALSDDGEILTWDPVEPHAVDAPQPANDPSHAPENDTHATRADRHGLGRTG